jgi:hypothetical protein
VPSPEPTPDLQRYLTPQERLDALPKLSSPEGVRLRREWAALSPEEKGKRILGRRAIFPTRPRPSSETMRMIEEAVEMRMAEQNPALHEALKDTGELEENLTDRALSIWQTMKALWAAGQGNEATKEIALHQWASFTVSETSNAEDE